MRSKEDWVESSAPRGASLRLEVQVARPPTRKCREVIAVMEEATRRFPGQVRLVVYERGAPFPETPTPGFLKHLKFTRVPKAFVNGKLKAIGAVPVLEDIVSVMEAELEVKRGRKILHR
jgi:hypothetical protein